MPGNESVVVTPPGGGEITVPAAELEASRASGAVPVSPDVRRNRQAAAEQKEAVHTWADKLITLGEAVVDTATGGLVHQHGPGAELRRAENPGAEFAGQVIGLAVGAKLPLGPLKYAGEAGEAAGRAAARGLLRAGEGSAVARVAGEAGAGAAMMGTWAAGGQLADAVVENKPISVDAIMDQVKLGGLMGFGTGVLVEGLGALGRVGASETASRAAVREQGGILGDEIGPIKSAWGQAMGEWSSELDAYRERLGAVKEMRQRGVLNERADEFLQPREAAIRDAERAHAKLDKFGEAPLDAEPGEYARWQAAREDFIVKRDALREQMRPRAVEVAPQPEPGTLEDLNAVVEKLPVREQSGAPTSVLSMTTGPSEAGVFSPATTPELRAQLQRMMDEKPAVGPGDLAAVKVQGLLNDLEKASGGRLDSAAAVRFAEKHQLRTSTDPFGGRMDQVWSLRRMGRMAADEARGHATGLRGGLKADLADIGVGLAFHSPMMALAARYFKFGGRLAAASGRLTGAVARVAQKLLTPGRVRALAAPLVHQSAYTYSSRGPIKDPLERIEEVRRLAQSPDAVTAQVTRAAGDLAVVHPALLSQLSTRAQLYYQLLAGEAPQIARDPMGRPVPPPAAQMRNFLDFEAALHDLPGLLKAVASGGATRVQIRALAQGFPGVHTELTRQLLQNPQFLARLDRAKLRIIETVTGASLTRASDPDYVLRQVQAWQEADYSQQAKTAALTPQALKINPEGAAMPSSNTATGRAPGN